MKIRNSLFNTEENFYYSFEMITIILYLILTITQEILVYQGYKIYQDSSNTYHRFVISERLTILEYPANVSFLHPYYGKYCEDNFSPIDIWSVNAFKNGNFVDITANTSMPNIFLPNLNLSFNNTEMNYKFYQFDINQVGDGYVDLSNTYSFNVWKGHSICSRRLILDDDYQAWQFIPKDQDCEKLFPNDLAVNCGTFFNFYKLCVLRNYLLNNNSEPLSVYYPYGSLENMYDVCPMNNLDVNFTNNPLYNESIPHILNTDYEYNLQYNISTTADEIYNNHSLFIDFDWSYFDGCQTDLNLTTPFFYYENDPYTFFIMPPGENWGVKDDFMVFLDDQEFTEYWTDYADQFNIMTGFLNDSTMTNFYQVVDQLPTTQKVVVNLALYQFYPPSSNCILKLMFNRNRYDFVNYINKVNIPNFNENLLTFLTWNIVSLFMAIYCSICIRLRFIILLKKNEAKAADKKDENIQKFSLKFLQFVIFCIKMMTLLNIINDIILSRNTVQELFDNNCYSKQVLIDSLLYSANQLDNSLIYYLISIYILLSVFFFELMNFLFYLKILYSKYREYKEKLRENEERKRLY